MGDLSLITFLFLLVLYCHFTSTRQCLLLGQKVKSDMSSGLSGNTARAQAGGFYQHSSFCLLHFSLLPAMRKHNGAPTGECHKSNCTFLS